MLGDVRRGGRGEAGGCAAMTTGGHRQLIPHPFLSFPFLPPIDYPPSPTLRLAFTCFPSSVRRSPIDRFAMKTVNLEFTKLTATGTYRVRCWTSENPTGNSEENCRLGPSVGISIPGNGPANPAQNITLGEFRHVLTNQAADFASWQFSERTQIELGQHLFAETFGRLKHFETERDIDLRICVDAGDEHLAALPWPLLARDGQFLVSSRGWTVSLVAGGELQEVELPPAPKLLVVIPEPRDYNTSGESHRDALRRLLEEVSPRQAGPECLHIASTWDEYRQALEHKTFDLVYYYGYGPGTETESRLAFAGDNGKAEIKAMRDFADALRVNGQSHRKLKLVYVNCCGGDSGGLLGAGRQLADVAHCVVTNRSFGTVAALQAQGLEFWRQLLKEGLPPHVAVARNYQSLGESKLSSTNPNWFTPVIHANYREWKSNPARTDRSYDLHWRLSLDRRNQFRTVLGETVEMLSGQSRRRAHAFLWYGEEDQGMELFHERLAVSLSPKLHDVTVVHKLARWPDRDAETSRQTFSERAFVEMLCEVFRVGDVKQIDSRVRDEAANSRALVVINHPHVTSRTTMDPKSLLTYLQWLDHVFPSFDDEEHFYLLGFSFRAGKGKVDEFRERLTQMGYDEPGLQTLRLDVLEPLESIKRRDLANFLEDHEIFIPKERRAKVIDHIMTETKGRYDATLRELQQLVEQGYKESLEPSAAGAGDSDSDSFGMDD